MTEDLRGGAVIVVAAVAIFAILLTIVRRRNAALRDVLLPIVTAAGWTELRTTMFFTSGVRGTWRSVPAELDYGARNRQVPERLVLRLGARSSTRLIVKRRLHGLWTRPFTIFGPRLVQLHHPAAQQFWIRSDEVAYGERVFSDERLVARIGENLVVAFDEVRIDGRGIRITRAVDERAVRERYGLPAFRMRFEPQRLVPVIREEIGLAEALATVVSR